jgi:microcystin degradation protein MlrC
MFQGQRLRVAVGGVSLESNDFVPYTADLATFKDTGFFAEGDAVFDLASTDTEIAGALAVLASVDADVIPLLAARGNSSGRLSADTYSQVRRGIMAPLEAARPVDGVFLFQHGSMEAVGEDDPEGDIAEAVRATVGPAVPIVMTCDLHGNVTRRMVENVDAILGYEHYPHDDARRTGERAAELLLRAISREARPTPALAKLPLILTAFNSSTLTDTPFSRTMAEAKALEREQTVLSASVFLVGSYIDAPDMGCSALVVADGDPARAAKAARALAGRFWARRDQFGVETMSVRDAVRRGQEVAGGPVLLLDTADTTGGGAAGDGIGAVRELLASRVSDPCLAMVVDPAAAKSCHAAGLGAELDLTVGHSQDPRWGEPLHVRGRVEHLLDGRFRYRAGILGGTEVTMGPSAVVAIDAIRLLVMSVATYDWGDDQYRAAGLDPGVFKFVVVKNMMNFRFGYRETMEAHYVLDLPGPTTQDMRSLPFERIRRPVFPLDRDFEPEIAVAVGRA